MHLYAHVYIQGFAGVCVGVGSHQEHMTLTLQRFDLGQREKSEVVRTLKVC